MTTTLTERSQSFGHLFVERVAKTPNLGRGPVQRPAAYVGFGT